MGITNLTWEKMKGFEKWEGVFQVGGTPLTRDQVEVRKCKAGHGKVWSMVSEISHQ